MPLVEGDLRDRDLVHDLTRANDLVFHQAAIRITQCAEEPRLALEVLVDGTFNVLEAAAEHKVDKLVLASSASVYGLAEAFPTDERHHHHNNDTFYGAAKSFNEGMARSFRAMHGLDYVALRYFNVYGPRMDVHGLYTEVLVRWMERIADGLPPLIFGDGSQTMDFVYTADIARANILAALSDVREGVYNIASGTETSCSVWPRRCCGRWTPTSASSTGRTAPSTASPAGWPTSRQLARDLGLEATTDLDDGTARARRLVAPAARRRSRAGRAGGASMSRINVMTAVAGRRGGRRGHRGASSPAGSPRARGWPQFEAAFAARMQAEHAVAVSSCTTGLHLALVVAGVGPGDDVVVPSFSFIATANAATYVGARPVFADVDPDHGQRHGRHRQGRPHPGHHGGHRRRPGRRAGRPPRHPRAVRPARDRRGRGRRLRRRLDVCRPAGRRGRGHRRLVLPPAQDRDDRRGRHDHDVPGRLGRPGPPAARARHERQRRRPARQRACRRRRSTSRSASTTG